MKKEIASRWVAALRSGKYKQGKLYLRNKQDCFCCLGVLCDISLLGKWKSNSCCYSYETEIDHHRDILPLGVIENTGMKTSQGDLVIDGIALTLAVLNDNHNMSFEDIASIIESRWEEL